MKITKKNYNSYSISELINLGISEAEKGNFSEAEKIYLKIIDLNENYLLAYFNLLIINESLFDEKIFQKIKYILKNSNLNTYEKSIANFIISFYERKKKNFKKEIYYLDKAYSYSFKSNENINKQSNYYFRKIIPSSFDKKKYIINKEIQKKFKIYNPIFIIGLPRSGSTLIETILSSSKERIPSCGESSIVNSTLVSMLRINFKSNDFKFNINYDIFSETILNKYKNLNLLNKNNKFYFLDKSLENFFYIDLILDLFPNAKFINCERNLFHISISIYQKFLIHLGWAHSYKNILDYIDHYLKVIQFYKKKFPDKIYDLNLEKFTTQNLKIAKEVFDFCGIKWDPSSLEFYKRNNLKSKTASTKQIRKKIYSYDQEKFKPYKDLAIKFSNEFSWLKKYF